MIFVSIFLYVIIYRILIITLSKTLKNYFRFPLNDSAVYFYFGDFYLQKKSKYDERNLLSNKPLRFHSFFVYFFFKVFPRNFILKKSFFPNLMLFILGIFLFFNYLFYINFNIHSITYIILILIFLPENIFFREWNINFISFSPRLLVILTNSFYWLLYLNINKSDFHLIYIIVIILGVISLFLSNFSRQSFVISNILFSIIDLSFNLYFIISIFLFFIVSPKKNFSLFYNQLLIFKWQSKRFFSKKLFNFITIKQNILTPIILFLLLIITFENKSYFNFFLVLTIIYIFTSLNFFSSIGENWRYITVNYFFIAPIVLYDFITNNKIFEINFFLILILHFFILILLNYNIRSLDKNSKSVHDLVKLNSEVKQKLKNARWYGAPFVTPVYMMNIKLGEGMLFFNKGEYDREIINPEIFPYIEFKDEIINNFNITHSIIHKDHLQNVIKKANFDLKKVKLLCETKNFLIYEII